LTKEDVEYEYGEHYTPIDVEVGGRCRRIGMVNYIFQWNG
jgi:hypothetical protein